VGYTKWDVKMLLVASPRAEDSADGAGCFHFSSATEAETGETQAVAYVQAAEDGM
jgi:hypothetical protein